MSGTLVMSQAVIEAVETAAAEPLETAGVILATYIPMAGGNFKLLAHSNSYGAGGRLRPAQER